MKWRTGRWKEEEGRCTFLAGSDALDADEKSGLIDIIATISEAFQSHQAWQLFCVATIERSLELRAVVAVLVDHEVAIPLTLGEDAREQWCSTGRETVVF